MLIFRSLDLEGMLIWQFFFSFYHTIKLPFDVQVDKMVLNVIYYVCIQWPKGPKLKSSPVYCSQIYLSLIWQLETDKPHYFVGCKQIPEKKFGHNSQLHVCPYHVNNQGPERMQSSAQRLVLSRTCPDYNLFLTCSCRL